MIFEDNQQFAWPKTHKFQRRIKHIDIKYHFIREQINSGTVELKYFPTEDMIADMLTKGLHKEKFVKLRKMVGIKAMNEQSIKQVRRSI